MCGISQLYSFLCSLRISVPQQHDPKARQGSCVLVGFPAPHFNAYWMAMVTEGKALVMTPLRAECYQRSSLLMALACVREATWVSSKP